MTRPPSQRRTLLFLVLLALLAVLYAQIRHKRESWNPRLEPLPERPEPPKLRLASDAPTGGPLVVRLNEPADFDGLTRAQVLEMRRQCVGEYLELVRGYLPSPAVYGQITDGSPWWGMLGHFIHGPGPRSIEGTSEESRFVLNPFLLVGIDLYGASIWNSSFDWDPAKLAETSMDETDLPLWAEPTALTWWPAESRAEAVYDVTTFLEGVAQLAAAPPLLPLGGTSLMPQNARDLGFDHLYLDLDASTHIAQDHHSLAPVPIRSFLHRGGSCGYEGGCNNGSPYQPEMDQILIETLPARMVIKLWRQRPGEVSEAAEFEFVIRLE